MKSWNLQIQVTLENGTPKQLEYRNRKRNVLRVLDIWRSCEGWWKGQPARDYWKLELANNTVVEIYLENIDGIDTGRWILARSFD